MKNKKFKYIKSTAFLLCTVIVVCALLSAMSIWNYASVDERRQADAVIILGAGTYNGEVSPVFRERLNHGIFLYQNGYVKKIILTGGYGKGNTDSDSYTAKLYVRSQGIPEADILCEEQSVITQENIQYAKAIMDEEQDKTAIIVSDPLHMKRAMLMAEDFGIQAYSSPTPTTRYRSLKNKLTFLGREVFFYMGYQIYRLL